MIMYPIICSAIVLKPGSPINLVKNPIARLWHAIISGQHKLIEWFETGAVELYNLENDPGEWTNLAADQPTLADSLLGMLQAWRADVDAQMPSPNPEWTGD